MNKIYAKSDGTTLYDHTVSVINISMFVLGKILKQSIVEYPAEKIHMLQTEVAAASILHDIGKFSCTFQKHIKKLIPSASTDVDDIIDEITGSKTPVISHNIISWAYASLYADFKNPRPVTTAILYHHVVPFDKDGFKSKIIINNKKLIKDTVLQQMHEFFDELSAYANTTFNTTVKRRQKPEESEISYTDVSLTNTIVINEDYYDDMFNAAEHFIVRSVLIYADRLASAHPEFINDFIANDTTVIESLYDKMLFSTKPEFPSNLNKLGYTDTTRNEYQDKVFNSFCNTLNPQICATAGFGKTMMGIRYHLSNNSKTLWVCPHNSICNEAYSSIKSELEQLGLSDKVSVALYLTGEYQDNTSPDADIIVTNIDNYLAPVIRNRNSSLMIKMLAANVIFDETQQFFTKHSMFSTYLIALFTRLTMTNSNTLTMSATPLDLPKFYKKGTFTSEFIIDNKAVSRFSYANDTKVKITRQDITNFSELKIQHKDCFVIVPTVRMVQDAYSLYDSEDKGIVHARYTQEDRTTHIDDIYTRHGKYSNPQQRNTFFGNGIINTGLNVSTKTIIDIPLTPADTIQVLGRAGRYPDKDKYDFVEYCILNTTNKNYIKDVSSIINQRYEQKLSRKWRQFIANKEGMMLTKGELYELYDEFNRTHAKEIHEMLKEFLMCSFDEFSKLRPYSVFQNNASSKLGTRLGFRGLSDDVYVCCSNNTDKLIVVEKDRIALRLNPDTGSERDNASLKARLNFLMQRVPDYRHKYGKSLPSIDEQLRLAKNPEYPILLTHSRYTKELGLILI